MAATSKPKNLGKDNKGPGIGSIILMIVLFLMSILGAILLFFWAQKTKGAKTNGSPAATNKTGTDNASPLGDV